MDNTSMQSVQVSPFERSGSSYLSASSLASSYSFLSVSSASASPVRTPSPRKALNDSPLQLHFIYQRRTRCRLRDEIDGCDSTTDDSLSGSSEDRSLSPRSEQFLERLNFARHESFPKFIPIPTRHDTFTNSVPRLLHNRMDKVEWNEVKTAYLQRRASSSLLVRNSKSDTTVILPDSALKATSRRQRLRRFLSKLKVAKSKRCKPVHDFSSTEEFEPFVLPKKSDDRFSSTINSQFIKINIQEHSDLSATLYIQEPGHHLGVSNLNKLGVNHGLCHVKTELAAAAMLCFFHPYSNVQCIWTKNLQNQLLDLLAKPQMKPKFSTLVYLSRFQAVLVLSRDAASLVRHRQTCFLQSLSSALQIGSHRLLVLINSSQD